MTAQTRRWLVDADELARLLAGDDPPLVLDARWNLLGPDGREEFEAGHVPGSRWVDLEHELSGHDDRSRGGAGRHPLPTPEVFQAAMRRVGLDPGRAVVAVDGGALLPAARLWWLLRDAGHDRVQVLDGGFAAWRAAGQPVETGPSAAVAPGGFVAGPPRLPATDAAGVQQALAEGRPVVDVRAAARYRGDEEPVDPVGGHVPGAQNLPSALLFGQDGRLLPPAELARVLGDLGPEPVLYCGSGVTASQTVLALAEAGREDGVLYAGSWSDWVSDPGRPVQTGG
ncbi:sulfurtransferase [Auraticoccus sp. F435]|uniref:Sulfurtransferase n=1 Tax=Auraticoccus cholistanensis TaxID=2656650 RepID=A0A6A9UVX5_9ACTN|nr:sulfurtransferase [Auraticoccus cholistanensis]MVA75724.1 sulfurtransferase [Auraticoccus cholistanensis]